MSQDIVKKTAEALVAYCKSHEEEKALAELYDPSAVSVEGADYSGMGRETAGIDGIRGKHAWWNENFEVHGGDVIGPFLHGEDRFAVIFEIDSTNKLSGERSEMREVAIYTTDKSGKIIREEFYY